MSKIPVLAVILVTIGLGSFVAVLAYSAYVASVPRTYQPGLVQQHYSVVQTQNTLESTGTFGYATGQWQSTPGQSVTVQQAVQMMRTPPSYANVVASNDTVSFDSQAVSVFVLAISPDRAVSLTGMHLPNYSSDNVFVIYGLINPTLVIPSGASVQFTVVNLDDDMPHNLVVSPVGPPYPYMGMAGMMSGYGMYGMPFLPPADYSHGMAREYSYALTFTQPGTYWYLCTYRDHAETGMYGRITVVA